MLIQDLVNLYDHNGENQGFFLRTLPLWTFMVKIENVAIKTEYRKLFLLDFNTKKRSNYNEIKVRLTSSYIDHENNFFSHYFLC